MYWFQNLFIASRVRKWSVGNWRYEGVSKFASVTGRVIRAVHGQLA